MKKIDIGKMDIKKIIFEFVWFIALGYVSFNAFIGSFFVHYSNLTATDEMQQTLLIGMGLWIIMNLCSLTCGVGFKRYLKKEYRLEWIPVAKELPRNVSSFRKRENHEKYLCLVEKETEGIFCEIPVKYFGDGKWMSKGEDISSRVYAWKKSL